MTRKGKLKSGRRGKSLDLMQILRRLNRADHRSAAKRGTSLWQANRLVRLLMRAHRVARSVNQRFYYVEDIMLIVLPVIACRGASIRPAMLLGTVVFAGGTGQHVLVTEVR